jgi:hypothetical protein
MPIFLLEAFSYYCALEYDRHLCDHVSDEDMSNWTQEQLEKVVKEREAKSGRKIHSEIVLVLIAFTICSVEYYK